MSSSNTETQVEDPAAKAVVPKQKKLKPARKQVKAGDVDKETAPQTGKEYSACPSHLCLSSVQRVLTQCLDIWYNKWAGGDREDNYSKYVSPSVFFAFAPVGLIYGGDSAARQNPKRGAASRKMPA
jgi:hypothetical protein